MSLYVPGVVPDNFDSAAVVAAGDGEVEIGVSVILRYSNKPSDLVMDGVASLTSYSNGHKTVNLITSVWTFYEESIVSSAGHGRKLYPAEGSDFYETY